jgi:hypothetical protein
LVQSYVSPSAGEQSPLYRNIMGTVRGVRPSEPVSASDYCFSGSEQRYHDEKPRYSSGKRPFSLQIGWNMPVPCPEITGNSRVTAGSPGNGRACGQVKIRRAEKCPGGPPKGNRDDFFHVGESGTSEGDPSPPGNPEFHESSIMAKSQCFGEYIIMW